MRGVLPSNNNVKASTPNIDIGSLPQYSKQYGCIEIMNNVFIDTDFVVLTVVRIGPNSVVGAGAVVTRDVEPGTIVGGVPARLISSFDKLVNTRKEILNPESSEDILWDEFYKTHDLGKSTEDGQENGV